MIDDIMSNTNVHARYNTRSTPSSNATPFAAWQDVVYRRTLPKPKGRAPVVCRNDPLFAGSYVRRKAMSPCLRYPLPFLKSQLHCAACEQRDRLMMRFIVHRPTAKALSLMHVRRQYLLVFFALADGSKTVRFFYWHTTRFNWPSHSG